MKQPNRKAPRFRKKAYRLLNLEFFLKLKKLHPDLMLSRPDVKKILTTFHLICVDVIAETRDGLELHEQLGNILLGKFKTDKMYSPDHKQTLKYNTIIQHTNWESNEWICKIFYSNYASKYRFRNSQLWGFEGSRELKKRVSEEFKKNPHKYIFADNYCRISHTFRLANKELREKLKQEKENLDT